MVIDNLPGAGGQIGFQAIANAKKDGYTFGCLYTPHLTAHVSAKRAQYTLASFDYVGNLVTDPGAIVVPGNSPIMDLKGLAEYVKNNENCTAPGHGRGSRHQAASRALQGLVRSQGQRDGRTRHGGFHERLPGRGAGPLR